MRIAALHDIHGNLPALEAAAAAVCRTSFPHAEAFASVCIQGPPNMLDTFTQYGLPTLQAAAHGA